MIAGEVDARERMCTVDLKCPRSLKHITGIDVKRFRQCVNTPKGNGEEIPPERYMCAGSARRD
ncbi:hypothetical protein NECAME_05694 [Necator americanus]|uniref:Uncharacterized protein n=1 Tax=Necator americanus TaxID=51031 RepID=W2SFB0_NECAM|nr:hypothetical protein NECAME_05694 [Necator americanus]ETN68213.1 hypothetical protein NECAME_05694 [Necator americanus]